METVNATDLPLPRVRTGKVRDVYAVGDDRILLVATDRVSAFDVVMREAVPAKGAVLTQLTAWWLRHLEDAIPHHMISADAGEIARMVPALAGKVRLLAGRAMLCRRTAPYPVECVIRGYITGSAWKEYSRAGTLAGEPLPKGLRESDRLEPAIFSPATKAESGHDENISVERLRSIVGMQTAALLEGLTRTVYERGRALAAERGIIVADTKLEFGRTPDGQTLLIDEVLTPDSSRFWPADSYAPGRSQPSFDKQPLRDYLERERAAGRWNGETPPPTLPADVVTATSARYLDAYRRITGVPLNIPEPTT
ncbi:MAG: phosphoribosylaminoimidazolesuccinocarboxamide synthase [Gemmatimonadaceae bacterium]|nr:phosphoribosylaminoimidazolesuccinocarboxamide synthase [Gemmatimonadaceae bacterium]NUQ92053.1 phosphoribosylaminoimidazolesuccinocarboxamide synthase [Gemmatimonadaceae bacterium]NUR19513.1 phosphoribosylaminoimidazolesuccinocarboxamide synthase [Gemmatimonadaceae bacterium]NUS97946.1 phosphoribosylaminoimidazolesuccinocarboxamide synthase [Gemmatimonadaceae bacterium]